MKDDPFFDVIRRGRLAVQTTPAGLSSAPKERAHSKFSASGAERWFNCPGSVALSEGLPDKSSKWAEEGTLAHEVLEAIMRFVIKYGIGRIDVAFDPRYKREMYEYAIQAARFIVELHSKTPDADILVETRIYLKFIHPEMFGTFDGAVIDYFGTLHVFDYKYGAGHYVDVRNNLQMIFYALGVAHLHHWNFKKVRLWIIQPRVAGYDGPTFWDLSIGELRSWVPKFREAVERVEQFPNKYVENSKWCHWCKAKSICPLKQENKLAKAQNIFSALDEPRKEIEIHEDF